MAMARREKPSAVLAVALGGPKGRQAPEMEMGPMGDEMGMEAEDELDPVFVDHAELAFPEITGDAERLRHLKEAIKACLRSDYGGGRGGGGPPPSSGGY